MWKQIQTLLKVIVYNNTSRLFLYLFIRITKWIYNSGIRNGKVPKGKVKLGCFHSAICRWSHFLGHLLSLLASIIVWTLFFSSLIPNIKTMWLLFIKQFDLWILFKVISKRKIFRFVHCSGQNYGVVGLQISNLSFYILVFLLNFKLFS